jgi:hypothetical protein
MSSFLFFIGAAAGVCTGRGAVLRRADEKQKGYSIKGGRSIDRSPLTGFGKPKATVKLGIFGHLLRLNDASKVQRGRTHSAMVAHRAD